MVAQEHKPKRLTDLIERDELQSIQDSLARATGLSTVIMDPDGNDLTEQSAPFVRFCEKVIKSTEKGRVACRDCDERAQKRALQRVLAGKPPQVRKCHAGLRDYVAPIHVRDELYGYLWCGRVWAREDGKPDPKEARKKAKEYGIEPGRYLRALKRVPRLPIKHIRASASVLHQVARSIASQAYEKLSQTRRAEEAMAALSERMGELTSLHDAAALVVRGGDPTKALQALLQQAQRAMDADCLCLYRYDHESEQFDEPLATGVRDLAEMKGPSTRISVVWDILQRKDPLFSTNTRKHRVLNGPFAKRERIVSTAALPLRVADRQVGVLFVNFRTRQQFPDSRKTVVKALANQTAIAIAYHRVVETLRSQAEQLARLHESVTALIKGPDLDTIFDRIVTSVKDALGYDAVALHLVDEAANEIDGQYAAGTAVEWSGRGPRKLDGPDILAHIWRNQQTEVLSGWDDRFDEDTYQELGHENWVRVFMPVRCRGKALGVIEAGYLLEHKRSIDQAEVTALASFVQQAEIAMHNTRSLAESRALLSIAETLGTERDTDKILNEIIAQIRDVIPCSTCSVDLLEKRTGLLRPRASLGVDAKAMLKLELKPGEGITWQVFESGEGRIVNEALDHPDAIPVPGTPVEQECLLIVPIRSGDQVLGTINLNRYGVAPFTEDDKEWVTAAADQVGVALERAELLERYQTLASSAKAIAQTLPLEQVLDSIVQHAAETLDAPVVNLVLLQDDGTLPVVAEIGLEPDFELPVVPSISVGLSGWVAQTREPYRTPDIPSDPHTANPEYLKARGHVSYLGVPMIHRDRLMGALNVHTRSTREFTDDEVAVFRAFADLAAVAVSNSQLFDQAVREFETVADAGAAVSSAVGLDPILGQLTEQACSVVGAARAVAFTVDDAEDQLVPRSWWPPDQAPLALARGKGVPGYVWDSRESYITPDASEDPSGQPFGDQDGSELAVPIIAQGHVMGVLDVASEKQGAFGKKHARLLSALADLSSVALEKVRLLSAIREVAEATLAPSAQSDFLAFVIQKAQGLIRVACALSIWLLDEPHGVVHYAAGDQQDPFANCAPLPLSGTVSGAVIETQHPVAVEHIPNEPLYFYKEIAATAGLKSLLSVPILAGDKAIGVFNVHTSVKHKFEDWETDVLCAFAAQVGAAIEINRTLTHLRLIQDYAAVVRAASSLSEVMNCVATRARDAIEADVACVWLLNSSTGRFEYGAASGIGDWEIPEAQPRPEGMSKRITDSRERVVIADTHQEPSGDIHPHAMDFGIRAIAGFPLVVGARSIGVLYVDFRHPYHYTSEQLDTLEHMANIAAAAIDNIRAIEARRDFLITVTHDLKAPLSAIDAQAQDLRDFGFEPEGLACIHGETRRLTQLIDTLLGLLRAEQAAKPVTPETVDLVEMLGHVEAVWSAMARAKDLDIEVSIAEDAKVVRSDRERVRCIVFNILDNAVKFSDRGGKVQLDIKRDDDAFAITVRDRGPGMAADQVARFSLAPGQNPGPYWEEMQAGVGYAAVRRFTADMSGEVRIESRPGETAVTVRLPFLGPRASEASGGSPTGTNRGEQ